MLQSKQVVSVSRERVGATSHEVLEMRLVWYGMCPQRVKTRSFETPYEGKNVS